MNSIINYYKLCTVAAGGRAHAVSQLPPEDKKKLVTAQFIAADDTVNEHVVGGGCGHTDITSVRARAIVF